MATQTITGTIALTDLGGGSPPRSTQPLWRLNVDIDPRIRLDSDFGGGWFGTFGVINLHSARFTATSLSAYTDTTGSTKTEMSDGWETGGSIVLTSGSNRVRVPGSNDPSNAESEDDAPNYSWKPSAEVVQRLIAFAGAVSHGDSVTLEFTAPDPPPDPGPTPVQTGPSNEFAWTLRIPDLGITAWSGLENLTFDGQTWTGMGRVVGISGLTNERETAASVLVTVDISDPDLRASLSANHGVTEVEAGILYSADFGATWNRVGGVTRGFLSEPVIDGTTWRASLDPLSVDLDRRRIDYWTSDARRETYPSDTCFDGVGKAIEGVFGLPTTLPRNS